MTGQGKETEDPPWRAVGRGDRAEGTGDPPWRGQGRGDRIAAMEGADQWGQGTQHGGHRAGGQGVLHEGSQAGERTFHEGKEGQTGDRGTKQDRRNMGPSIKGR